MNIPKPYTCLLGIEETCRQTALGECGVLELCPRMWPQDSWELYSAFFQRPLNFCCFWAAATPSSGVELAPIHHNCKLLLGSQDLAICFKLSFFKKKKKNQEVQFFLDREVYPELWVNTFIKIYLTKQRRPAVSFMLVSVKLVVRGKVVSSDFLRSITRSVLRKLISIQSGMSWVVSISSVWGWHETRDQEYLLITKHPTVPLALYVVSI